MSKYDLWQLLCEGDEGRGGGLLGNVGGATAQFAAVHFLNAFFNGTYKFEEVSTAATSSRGDDCVLQVTSADGQPLGNIFIELKDGGGEFYQQGAKTQAALNVKLGYKVTGRGKTKGPSGEHYVMVFPGGKNYQKCYLFQGGRSGSPLPPTAAVWGKNIPEMPHSVLGNVTPKNSRPISISRTSTIAATLQAPAGAVSDVSIMKDAVVRLNSDGWRQRNREQLANLIGVSASEIKRVQEHMDAYGNSALPSMWHRKEARWYPYIAKLYDNPDKSTGKRTNVVDAYQNDLWPQALANANSDAYTLHSIGVPPDRIIPAKEEEEAKEEGEKQVKKLEGAALIDGADELIDQAAGDESSIDDLMDDATSKMEAIRVRLKSMATRGNTATSYLGDSKNVSWMSYGKVFTDPKNNEKYLRYIFGLPDDYEFASKDMTKLIKMASYKLKSIPIGKICEWWIVEVCKTPKESTSWKVTFSGTRRSIKNQRRWFQKNKNRKDLSEIEAALPSLRALIKKEKFTFSGLMNEGKYSLKSRLLD